MRTCTACDAQHHARGYCTRHYAQVRAHGRVLTDAEARGNRPATRKSASSAKSVEVDARIEDLDFLLDTGLDLELALARLDWTAHAAERALYRRGRVDLARAAGSLAHQTRARKGAA